MQSSNKTIAKNTLFLYFRMLVTMIISLYTSRVVLRVLGIDDYGIYQVVGSVVGFLSFINNALSAGSSRFITFGLGDGDDDKLKKIFSTSLTAHMCLALIIIVIAETIGLWFLHNKLAIPSERAFAAEIVFHLSILASFFSLTQVPYGACIIAHEKMSIYAYVSIVDAILKLLIVYALTVSSIDKLILYALLLCILQIAITIFYMAYCSKKFKEARFKIFIDKKIFKEIASFSGWSLLSNGSMALNGQGILILLKMFFSPEIVTARALSLQVYMAANQFFTNFQTASNPQIVKRYAANDFAGSKRLLLQTTMICYYLMLIICLPICLCAEPILNIWLEIVPEYTVVFVQIIIVQSLFSVFDTSFYRALYAKGRIKENAILTPLLGYIQFPVIYFLFKAGFSPVVLSWTSLVTTAILGLVVKPLLIVKIVNYTWKDIFSVFVPCMRVTLVSVVIPILSYVFFKRVFVNSQIALLLVVSVISVVSVCLTAWLLGMTQKMKIQVKEIVQRILSIIKC